MTERSPHPAWLGYDRRLGVTLFIFGATTTPMAYSSLLSEKTHHSC